MPDSLVFDRFCGFSKGLPGNSDEFMQETICKNKVICLNVSGFLTLGNNCDGNCGLEFDLRTEDQTKIKRLAAFDA